MTNLPNTKINNPKYLNNINYYVIICKVSDKNTPRGGAKMPNIKSAIKRVKVIEKKTLENNKIKSAYKTAVKKYEVANTNGDKSAVELLNKAKKLVDHAATKGVISKNAATRKKSKLDLKLAVK